MNVQVDFWQLVSLLLAFLAAVAGGAKVLFGQIDRRLDERFTALETARTAADNVMQEAIRRHTDEEGKTAAQLQALERDFLRWQAELPLQYVRREDYVRGQSVIEAKLDALYSELKVVQIKGATPHG